MKLTRAYLNDSFYDEFYLRGNGNVCFSSLMPPPEGRKLQVMMLISLLWLGV